MANGNNGTRKNGNNKAIVPRNRVTSSTNFRMQAIQAQRNAKTREINSQVRDIRTKIERLQSEIAGKQRKIESLAGHISVLEDSKRYF